jgi:hypothetical protein
MTTPLPAISIPTQTDRLGLTSVLENIAATTLKHLRQGGYLSEAEASALLAAYRSKLGFGISAAPDFLNFIAEAQAQKHSLTVDGEVARMQKLLRSSLNDRVHYWSFGPLSGKASSLYDHCPDLRQVCAALGCPATLAGESSIVHVASINPVSALVASFWIGQELNRTSEGESPFIFTFLTDLSSWQILLQRHFV